MRVHTATVILGATLAVTAFSASAALAWEAPVCVPGKGVHQASEFRTHNEYEQFKSKHGGYEMGPKDTCEKPPPPPKKTPTAAPTPVSTPVPTQPVVIPPPPPPPVTTPVPPLPPTVPGPGPSKAQVCVYEGGLWTIRWIEGDTLPTGMRWADRPDVCVQPVAPTPRSTPVPVAAPPSVVPASPPVEEVPPVDEAPPEEAEGPGLPPVQIETPPSQEGPGPEVPEEASPAPEIPPYQVPALPRTGDGTLAEEVI